MTDNKTYYTIPETFTNRQDIDPIMKLVIINIYNKLQIPKDKLTEGVYTFSVSNVASEMGLKQPVTFNKFAVLEKLKLIKRTGTKITTHGEVVLYIADSEILEKILNGNIKNMSPKLKKVLHQVKKIPSSPSEVGSSPSVIRMTPSEVGSSLGDTSTQIEYSNTNNQINSTQMGNSNTSSVDIISKREQHIEELVDAIINPPVSPNIKKLPEGLGTSYNNKNSVSPKTPDEEFDSIFKPKVS